MRIDIWSDVVCPWCYLGAHRLEAALDEVGRDGVEVRWHAFQLDPTAPAEPRDLRRSLEGRYGQGSFDTMTERIIGLGAAEGLDYRFDRTLAINTVDAHRLVAWAGQLDEDNHGAGHGVEGEAEAEVAANDGAAERGTAQGRLVERLFRGHFTDGEDLSDRAALVAAAADVGLDGTAAGAVLDGDAYEEQVRRDQEEARERGITGVPAFVIDDQWLIPGAQDVDRLVMLLRRVRGDRAAAR